VLTNFLSDNLTVGQLTPNEQLIPHRLLYNFWLGFICLGLLAAIILWTLNNNRRLRVAIFLLNGVFTVQLLVATLLIVVRLLQSTKVSASALLVDGLAVVGHHQQRGLLAYGKSRHKVIGDSEAQTIFNGEMPLRPVAIQHESTIWTDHPQVVILVEGHVLDGLIFRIRGPAGGGQWRSGGGGNRERGGGMDCHWCDGGRIG